MEYKLTRISKSETIGHAPEREQATARFDGPNETFEQLTNVFLDPELFRGGQELYYKVI
jgi:hypothetical protein